MTLVAPISVHLRPDWIPPGALRGGVAVVIDVLRASTVMIQALAAGCTTIRPCLEIDEARRTAAAFPAGTALLAGERRGSPIEGFDLGNSPSEFTPEQCRGRTLIMTTSNGTRALLACLEADRILIGAFTNRQAVLDALQREERPIHLVASGTDHSVSLEDTLLAGALAEALTQDDAPEWLDDSAQLAVSAWQHGRRAASAREGSPRAIDPSRLARVLARGRGGRRLTDIGFAADIVDAAKIDRHEGLLPELVREPVLALQIAPT